MSTVISMLIGSKFSTKELVTNSVLSIIKNMGCEDYHLVIGIAPYIRQEIKRKLIGIRNRKKTRKNITIVEKNCHTFATFTNYVFSKYASKSKWFIVAHDDIELKTPNFIPTVKKTLSNLKENIGWISFTDDDYLNRHWAPSTRPGYHYDFIHEKAWDNHQMFQFHSLEKEWMENGCNFRKIDYPSSPVICHAPFSHFIMIESEKLKEIGSCANWSEVSLLVDEDWGLSAMQKGFRNIWIPDIIYTHCRLKVGTRAQSIIIKRQLYCIDHFQKKWGIRLRPVLEKHVDEIIKKYGNTNIAWSIGKRSFEWDYVK